MRMHIRRPRRHVTATAWLAGAIATLLTIIVVAQPAAAPTPAGEWHQFDDRKGDLRSIIRIELVDGQLAGTIVKAVLRPGEPPNPVCDKCPGEFKDKPIEGLRFMWGLTGAGRAWDGGRILDPEDGKIYRVRLRLGEDGRTLEVRGYLGISLFGRSQRWTRAS